jgi:hypothetical protein
MTSYDKTFNSHPLHNQVKSLKNKIKDIETDTLTSDYRDQIHRINQVTDVIINMLDKSEPAFISQKTLNNLNSYVSSVFSELNSYSSNKNVGHIQNATNNLDSVLVTLPQIFSIRDKSDLRGFKSSAVSFRDNLGKEFDNFRESAKEQIEEITSQKDELQNDFEKVSEKLSETEIEISNQKKRLDEAIAEFQQQFSSTQENNRKELSASEKEREKRFNDLIVKNVAEFSKLSNDVEKQKNKFEENYKTTMKNFSSKLEDYDKQVNKMLGIITEKVLTNDFNINSEKEATRARYWLIATGTVFATLIGFALFIFYNVVTSTNQSESPNYPVLLTKLSVLAILGIVARWTTKQANRHQEEERRFKRMALELATINPYLADLPENNRIELKSKHTEKIFGQVYETKETPKQQDSSIEFPDLKTLTEGIKTISDAVIKK